MRKKPSALRNLRRARLFNQEDFARLLGVSQQTYSKYESGLIVPPPDRRARIATMLGTSVAVLWPETVPEEAHA